MYFPRFVLVFGGSSFLSHTRAVCRFLTSPTLALAVTTNPTPCRAMNPDCCCCTRLVYSWPDLNPVGWWTNKVRKIFTQGSDNSKMVSSGWGLQYTSDYEKLLFWVKLKTLFRRESLAVLCFLHSYRYCEDIAWYTFFGPLETRKAFERRRHSVIVFHITHRERAHWITDSARG